MSYVDERIIAMLETMATLFAREIPPTAAAVMLRHLAEFPPEAVLKALDRCVAELPRFPTVAEIIIRIDDGRLGAEEAWALVPKSEAESAVWTDEMREAFAIAQRLLPDEISARMAFREAYNRLVADARAQRKPVNWTATLGTDARMRDGVLARAVELGRIGQTQAAALLPYHEAARSECDEELVPVTGIVSRLIENLPDRDKMLWKARLEKTEILDEDEVERRRKRLQAQARILNGSAELNTTGERTAERTHEERETT